MPEELLKQPHYNSHPSGVEAWTIARWYNFNLGNVIKYLWRAGLKEGASDLEDLKKARNYLDDEIKRREGVYNHEENLLPRPKPEPLVTTEHKKYPLPEPITTTMGGKNRGVPAAHSADSDAVNEGKGRNFWRSGNLFERTEE